MLDIIENPTAYNMPCLFPESIRVDRILEDREPFEWKDFRMTAYYFPGQTLFHAGLLVEKDGLKVFLSGDAFCNWGPGRLLQPEPQLSMARSGFRKVPGTGARSAAGHAG
jgi:glyoxylase-like metal-dependent hydrolase (beta-lactamase superfamily II)